jgi:hypothetical protein
MTEVMTEVRGQKRGRKLDNGWFQLDVSGDMK